MKSSTFRVRERSLADGSVSYQVDAGIVNGKRHRRQFPTKREAEDYARKLREAGRQKGTLAFEMSAAETSDAVTALQRLKPLGVKLSDVVDYYLSRVQPKGGSRSVSEVIAEFLDSKEKTGKKPRYIQQLKFKLDKFARSFGASLVSEVTTEHFQQWRDSQNFASLTRINYQRELGIFFRFANRRGYCAGNPVDAAEKVSHTPTPPEVLTIPQVVVLLGAAMSYRSVCDLVPYITIGLFAGLRSSEIEALKWSDVQPLGEHPTITVDAKVAKTRQRRVVSMLPNLVTWLTPYQEDRLAGRPIVCSCWREHFQEVIRRAEFSKWPKNALRHSFGSYHLAKHRDIATTAHEMGNSPGVIDKHYKQLVQPADARDYFRIVAPAPASWYWTIFENPGEQDDSVSDSGRKKLSQEKMIEEIYERLCLGEQETDTPQRSSSKRLKFRAS